MDHHAFLIKKAVRKAGAFPLAIRSSGALARPGLADKRSKLLRSILVGAGLLGGGAVGYGAYKALSGGEEKEKEGEPVKAGAFLT